MNHPAGDLCCFFTAQLLIPFPPMYATLQPDLTQQLQEIKDAGLFKKERIITSPQGAAFSE